MCFFNTIYINIRIQNHYFIDRLEFLSYSKDSLYVVVT